MNFAHKFVFRGETYHIMSAHTTPNCYSYWKTADAVQSWSAATRTQ